MTTLQYYNIEVSEFLNKTLNKQIQQIMSFMIVSEKKMQWSKYLYWKTVKLKSIENIGDLGFGSQLLFSLMQWHFAVGLESQVVLPLPLPVEAVGVLLTVSEKWVGYVLETKVNGWAHSNAIT